MATQICFHPTIPEFSLAAFLAVHSPGEIIVEGQSIPLSNIRALTSQMQAVMPASTEAAEVTIRKVFESLVSTSTHSQCCLRAALIIRTPEAIIEEAELVTLPGIQNLTSQIQTARPVINEAATTTTRKIVERIQQKLLGPPIAQTSVGMSLEEQVRTGFLAAINDAASRAIRLVVEHMQKKLLGLETIAAHPPVSVTAQAPTEGSSEELVRIRTVAQTAIDNGTKAIASLKQLGSDKRIQKSKSYQLALQKSEEHLATSIEFFTCSERSLGRSGEEEQSKKLFLHESRLWAIIAERGAKREISKRASSSCVCM